MYRTEGFQGAFLHRVKQKICYELDGRWYVCVSHNQEMEPDVLSEKEVFGRLIVGSRRLHHVQHIKIAKAASSCQWRYRNKSEDGSSM